MDKEWRLFCNPFGFQSIEDPENLQLELINLQNSTRLRVSAKSGIELFAMLPKSEFPNLRLFASRLSAMFGSTYVCEQFFTTMTNNKTVWRSRVTDDNLVAVLRLCVSESEPDFNALTARKRCQMSKRTEGVQEVKLTEKSFHIKFLCEGDDSDFERILHIKRLSQRKLSGIFRYTPRTVTAKTAADSTCAVSSTQKFLVQQHITTSKHQANKQLNSKQRQLFLTQPTTSNVRSEFNIDLCRSLISADIPLYKLKNKVFREFLEKYTQHTIPNESTLRKTYAPSIYDETIQKIRDEIKDSSIWVSIDETPDKEGRLVGNVVIGLLSEQYSERILLHCDVLEKCNNKTIVKLFNEAMGILWPKGIMYDNVLFFISDAAPYMVKAGQALSVVYPKLTHFTCVAHAFHRVAEVVRDNFLK
ncbi:hypothetical protein ANN_22462 [Periplaneta americana]|uniref:DUF659 domain-containing protein n=1 Tax=Periplaneta americana TaxID=6978 RepID=A0ABQ8S8V8_PERAM|nr:hypothetical protein ANN_22462 [Periplaneta americana]